MRWFHHLAWLAVAVAARAAAMECPAAIDPQKVAREAEFVFTGRALAVQPIELEPVLDPPLCWPVGRLAGRREVCGGKIVTLEVIEAFKGKPPSRVRVYARDGCYCLGGYFEASQDYFIVAERTRISAAVDLLAQPVCEGTGPLRGNDDARAVIEHLRARRPR